MSNPTRTRRFVYFGQEGIGGGLSSENPIVVAPNQMTVADNILIGTALSRKKRGGQALWHTGSFIGTASFPASGTPIRGLVEWWRTAGIASPVSDLFVHHGSSVWSADERNTAAVNRTGALSLGLTGVPCYQAFGGVLYFTSTNVSDGYNKWDGSSATAVAATDPSDGAGKYLCEHRGRMWMAGNNDYPFRVYYSSALEAEVWTNGGGKDGGSLDLVDDGDPEGITGLTSFQNRLYVFTRRSIFEITGTTISDFVVQRVSNGIGCIGHASIAHTPNDVIFCSDRGVHSLRQIEQGRITTTSFLSRDIQRMWTALLNTALYGRIMAAYDETINCYVITVPSSGQTKNDTILTYNIEFGTWTQWPYIDARSISTVLINNKKHLIIGKEDGRIALLNQASRADFGSGYTGRWKTGVLYPGGDMTVQRRFLNVTVLAATTTPTQFSVGWTIDGRISGSKQVELTAGEDVLGTSFTLGESRMGVGQYTPCTITIENIGYGIQLECSAMGTSDVEFYGFVLEVEDANQSYR